MKINTLNRTLQSGLCAIALCSVGLAQAADGFFVNAAQQASVKVGMSRAQVNDLLGQPKHNRKYRSELGRTWTYGVLGLGSGRMQTIFDVDFTADGRVRAKSQRQESVN